ncbi:MAG: PaaI family thioesterase [Actinomycetaceae bacterium]|nr:PaaI family thioesterase [Actinomycetaceae bacterium]
MSTSDHPVARVLDAELAAKMGVVVTAVATDCVVEEIPTATNIQPFGLLHGGANAFLVEDAGSRLAIVNCPENKLTVGTELNISHLAPNRTRLARATARPIRISQSSAVVNVDIHDENGVLTATGRLTCVYITSSSRQPAQ